nr:protein scribble homolog [Misgurnus anguillicaudatus]
MAQLALLEGGGCRAVKNPANSSCHGWPIQGLRWVTRKERLSRLNLFPVSTGGHGRSSVPKKDAEEMYRQTDDYSLGNFTVFEGGRCRPKQWRENDHIRKLQRYRSHRLVTNLHRDTARDPECFIGSIIQRPYPHKPLTSQVPLRFQIKVNGQSGGLGICIAGGKGSVPYQENDEGIFISKVSKGGPAEKAGVCVGDRVLEVNGQDVQEVSHHEAVGALRTAGSCIKIKVLRERRVPVEPLGRERTETMATDPQLSQEWDVPVSRDRPSALQSPDPTLDCMLLESVIDVSTCNANRSDDLEEVRPMKDTESSNNNAIQVVKNTMTIPRIILTHPSTSDEDAELLTQGPNERDFYDFSGSDGHICPDSLNNAFNP